MLLVTLSDIHIKDLDDDGYRCLIKFFNHPKTQTATHIALLGDIFDLMAGDHEEYLKRWEPIFKRIEEFCHQGKIVFFAEGNHDMHLSRLAKRLTRSWKLEIKNNFKIIENSFLLEMNGTKIHLSHGDEFNQEDTTYLRYKKFIKKPMLAFVANYLMPLPVLDYIGKQASKKSRAYGSKKYDEENIKNKFRRGVKDLSPPEAEIIVGGHSHVLDCWKFEEKTYINNGFPPKSDFFIVIDENGPRFENLTKTN